MAKGKDFKQHQQELAKSGYRLPDSMYVASAVTSQPSAEQESGDGGRAASEEDQESEHGYKGKLVSAEEFAASSAAEPTVDPETGEGTIPVEGVKNGVTPEENKSAAKKTTTKRAR